MKTAIHFHALCSLILLTNVDAQDYSVYFQQGSFVRVNGHALPWTYEDGKDTELREAFPDTNFDGGSAGVDGPDGPSSLAKIVEGTPEGVSAYVVRFDEVFTGKYLPLKSGYRLTGAYLGLEFDKIGSDLDMLVNRTPWDAGTTTWNSFGSAGDGVNPDEDAEPIRPIALYGNQILIDVT